VVGGGWRKLQAAKSGERGGRKAQGEQTEAQEQTG